MHSQSIGVMIVQNRMLSHEGLKHNLKHKRTSHNAGTGNGIDLGPDIVAGQIDGLPSERGHVGQLAVGDIRPLRAQLPDGTVEIEIVFQWTMAAAMSSGPGRGSALPALPPRPRAWS